MQPCSVCPRLYNALPGDGPSPCRLLFIGERPGETENNLQQVFVGKSGEELNETYLQRSGYRREDVRVTNTVRCWAENSKTPTDKEIETCGHHHLPREITRCKPEVIVLLGASACKLAGGLINLETHHGRPIRVKNFLGSGWNGPLWPTYHPAGAMRKTEFMTAMLEDFELLGKWLRGKWSPPEPPTIQPLYGVIKAGCLESARYAKEIAVDTERHGSTPFSLQFSCLPGTGWFAQAHEKWFFSDFNKLIQDKTVILHNAPQDLDLLAKFGVYPVRVRDTMQEAFHQGDLPQKLKALAYRLLGAVWNSWAEVVRPASQEKAIQWMGEAIEICQADLRLLEVKRYKKLYKGAMVKETWKPSPVEQALTRIIRCAVNPEYDIWEKVEEIWFKDEGFYRDDILHIEARIGKMPILGIGNCDLGKAVQYGCADADYTLQVARALEKRRKDGRYAVDEADADGTDADRA